MKKIITSILIALTIFPSFVLALEETSIEDLVINQDGQNLILNGKGEGEPTPVDMTNLRTSQVIFDLKESLHNIEITKEFIYFQGLFNQNGNEFVYLERKPNTMYSNLWLVKVSEKKRTLLLKTNEKFELLYRPIEFSNSNGVLLEGFKPDSLYSDFGYELAVVSESKPDLKIIKRFEYPILKPTSNKSGDEVYYAKLDSRPEGHHDLSPHAIYKLKLQSAREDEFYRNNDRIITPGGWKKKTFGIGALQKAKAAELLPQEKKGLLLPLPYDYNTCVTRTWYGAPNNTSSGCNLGNHTLQYKYDFDCVTGDSVVASEIGIAYRGYEAGGYGNYIKVVHGTTNTRTIYAHLSSFSVGDGEKVSRGMEIGKCGSTGSAQGDHVHFEYQNESGSTRKLAVFNECNCSPGAGVNYKSKNYQCSAPKEGNWLVNVSCLYRSEFAAPGNVEISNNSTLTVDYDDINKKYSIFDINFRLYFLKILEGSGVIVKEDNKIN